MLQQFIYSLVENLMQIGRLDWGYFINKVFLVSSKVFLTQVAPSANMPLTYQSDFSQLPYYYRDSIWLKI